MDTQVSALKELITLALESCVDSGLLDLILKLLIS